jgi:predicted nucleic acid-binding Zn ribbon protein
MGNRRYQRTPRNYDGCERTVHTMQEVLPFVLRKLGRVYEEKGAQVIGIWSEVIGQQMAHMTKAVSFREGVLLVNVRSNTLYSLLVQGEKQHILKKLRDRVPHAKIKDLRFRIG